MSEERCAAGRVLCSVVPRVKHWDAFPHDPSSGDYWESCEKHGRPPEYRMSGYAHHANGSPCNHKERSGKERRGTCFSTPLHHPILRDGHLEGEKRKGSDRRQPRCGTCGNLIQK